MPKVVDHEARRAEVVAATMRVIQQVGLEGVTVRAIAQEAGCSTGVLAHYFANKAEILVTAHLTAFDAVRARIASRARDVTDPVQVFRLALEEAFPLDLPRLLEAQIDVSFWGLALHDDHLRAVRRASHEDAVLAWQAMAETVVAAGRARPGTDPHSVGVQSTVLVDGVSVDAVLFPDVMDAARQHTLIEEHLRGFVAD